ncbi:MAG TPA: entericidin A/B family lipoprotein [Vitreimonas sp.]|uniref:entericidin A/B family lipoprotein n=1 Tax=Vitreimonas sp. TaxID=3069702 RepID=UPI002D323C01|nr:entericidin A/B family lipoprotein [Vitreimonas sp.]HYD88023.1 entericidin A/B family lipoprotein [Vitreimonas sp.]
MSKKITSPLIALAALVGAASLGACNTVEGVGEDIQQAGETVEESADDVGSTEDPTP